MAKHTREELALFQSLPLEVKIRMTEQRIKGWVNTFGQDGVYVSFSGGKDSTVLLDIVRNRMQYDNIPAVFCDTGLEYPEIRNFVKSYEDVTWLRPEMNFKQVIEKYGYPFISKEVSYDVYTARKFLDDPKKYAHKKPLPVNKNGAYRPYSLMKLEGELDTKMFNQEKWHFLLNAPFKISNICCDIFKKMPAKHYGKESGRKPILATMASESRMRRKQWFLNGCNGFDMKSPVSNPMSFWTEQDVLLYIKKNHIPICSVYGDIVDDVQGTEEVDGQMTISDIVGWEDQEGFDAQRRPLRTTGCNRTGCMFCGYGCHLEKGEGRFELMKRTHPKQYEWIMKPWSEGGLGYKEVIDWINEHGNLNIRY